MAQQQNTDIDSPRFGGISEVTDLGRMQGPARVRFGPLEHQEISIEVASMMLTMWRDRHAAQFGAVLAEAMTGIAPRAGRNRGTS